jgi:hypothetical protein
MNPRRAIVGVSAAALLLAGILAGPVDAGVQAPHDMIATPNTGPVGTSVEIYNADNSPCGGQQGDGPAEVSVEIERPDGDVEGTTATPDEEGDWSVGYIDTDVVGSYVVNASCFDVESDVTSQATDFLYSPVTFVITGQATTATTAPTTTSTAAPASAVDATAQFTG